MNIQILNYERKGWEERMFKWSYVQTITCENELKFKSLNYERKGWEERMFKWSYVQTITCENELEFKSLNYKANKYSNDFMFESIRTV